uniref:Ig-like domain-containing protein n=1 Tax=Marinicella sediminis TaxID=1792834 RepID=UPI0012FF717D
IIDPEQDNTLALYLHQADGSPLTGTQVQLTVFKGPGTGTVLNGTSDGSGQVSFQLSHSVNGTDRLRYEFTHNNQLHRCLALARWEVDIIFADGFGD